MNATGTALIYSTYLGGSVSDSASAIAFDKAGDAYITGQTYSFPVTKGAYQTTNPVGNDSSGTGFVAKLSPTGSSLLYAPTETVPAKQGSPANYYTITMGQGTLASPNYLFILENNFLHITAPPSN